MKGLISESNLKKHYLMNNVKYYYHFYYVDSDNDTFIFYGLANFYCDTYFLMNDFEGERIQYESGES